MAISSPIFPRQLYKPSISLRPNLLSSPPVYNPFSFVLRFSRYHLKALITSRPRTPKNHCLNLFLGHNFPYFFASFHLPVILMNLRIFTPWTLLLNSAIGAKDILHSGNYPLRAPDPFMLLPGRELPSSLAFNPNSPLVHTPFFISEEGCFPPTVFFRHFEWPFTPTIFNSTC